MACIAHSTFPSLTFKTNQQKLAISVIGNGKVIQGPRKLSVTANFPLLQYPLLTDFCYNEIKKKKSGPGVTSRYTVISVTLGSGIAKFYCTTIMIFWAPVNNVDAVLVYESLEIQVILE